MDFAPTFQMGQSKAFEAVTKIARHTLGDLKHIFFVNSGSEAVDTTLKIALAYYTSRGEGRRTRFIGCERGYHGVGFGGISVGGIAPNNKAFSGGLLPAVDHFPHTLNIKEPAFSKGQPAWCTHLSDELERLVMLHDASTIAEVIVEPVAGSTGVLISPQGYLQRLREICNKHGVLLEFGRRPLTRVLYACSTRRYRLRALSLEPSGTQRAPLRDVLNPRYSYK